jgi:5-(carboxyamino)imidazole ribonucleotide mutase
MTIDDKFREIMQSNTGCAVIMAGSDSDDKHIEKIIESMKEYEIPYQVRICSAHKQPEKLMALIREYNNIKGSAAYIAIAGGTDALSGTLSFHLGPVISCPPDAPNQSCLTNPPGSSNAYIAKAGNVGKFIAQIYAYANPKFRGLLEKKNAERIGDLEKFDAEFQARYKGY